MTLLILQVSLRFKNKGSNPLFEKYVVIFKFSSNLYNIVNIMPAERFPLALTGLDLATNHLTKLIKIL